MTDDVGPNDTSIDASDRDAVLASLSEAAVPLATTDPTASLDDAGLEAVGAAIGKATIVGLGEASHGTREFFRLKHRLFRYLAEEHGFRLLALEANVAAMFDVNDYVLDGEGTVEEVADHDCIHGVYRTEEVRDLLAWARSFNENRPRDDRIRIHGLDTQFPSAAVDRLEAYLDTVTPDVLDDLHADFDRLHEYGSFDFSDDEALHAHLDAREAVVSTLESRFNQHEDEYVAATSRRAYERAHRLVWTIEQGRKQFAAVLGGDESGDNVRVRDSAMAAQALWLRRHESVEKLALWGHNAHLSRDAFRGGETRRSTNLPSLGQNLVTLGSVDYYALGLHLGGGAVQAYSTPDEAYCTYEMDAPPEESLPALFRQADASEFFLDFSTLPADDPLTGWLDSCPRRPDIVGGYQDSPVEYIAPNLLSQFDGFVFLEETSAARSLSTAD